MIGSATLPILISPRSFCSHIQAMLDPIPPPPAFLQTLTEPFASYFHLRTLPLHVHEVFGAALFYYAVQTIVSPRISTFLFPKIYPKLNYRTRLNWDVHVVSLVQSLLISSLALWVMWNDEERWNMDWKARVWGYTGACGMIQGLATGYFLWDLVVSLINVNVFGFGLLAHAISALLVFSLGFRPMVNFYGPTFILYELSSPFLNFHWFFDKVNMTGSKAQWYNGILLIGTFFCCRLCWGTYQSFIAIGDIFNAVNSPGVLVTFPEKSTIATQQSIDSRAELMRFAGERVIPAWMAYSYLGANLTLNILNFFWFSKMIETVRKRFQPKDGGTKPVGDAGSKVSTETDGHGEKIVTVEKAEVRKRRKA